MPWNRREDRTAAIRESLLPHAEELFLAVFGQPTRRSKGEWRARRSEAVSMVMAGPKRGLWRDHAADEGGDLLDLVARAHCGLVCARGDFPTVLDAAAGLTGQSPADPPDPHALRELKARRGARAAEAERVRAHDDECLLLELIARGRPVTPASPPGLYLRSRAIIDWPDTGLCRCPPLEGVRIRGARFHSLVFWGRSEDGMPVGGQRILLTGTGGRVTRGVTKPTFGRVGGFPARLPSAPNRGDDTLIIAEGPESALSAWLATGFETWAVFGVSNWRTAPLPPNRRVILCPDRDASGSPADRAFRKAVDRHHGAGITMWIAAAPEPDGSKRDLNDTLRRAGPAAVRGAIDAARPVTESWPEIPKEEGRR